MSDLIEETERWAVEVGLDEFGAKWKELAPLLIRRIPFIVEAYRNLRKELDISNQRAQVAETGRDEDKSLVQRYLGAARLLNAETPETLIEAIRLVSSQIVSLKQEKDEFEVSLANIQESLERKEDEIEELRPLAAQLLETKIRLNELQEIFEDIKGRHEEMHQRTLMLEDSLEDAQEQLKNARKEYEEHLIDLQADAERTMQDAYLPVQEWKERTITAEAEVLRLQDKLRKFKDTLSEVVA